LQGPSFAGRPFCVWAFAPPAAHAQEQGRGKRPAQEAHHELPHGHSDRFDWRHMKALCLICHVQVHQGVKGDGDRQSGEVAVSRTPSPPAGDDSPAAMKVMPAAVRAVTIAAEDEGAMVLPPSKRRTVATPTFAASARSWAVHSNSALALRHWATDSMR